MALYWKKLKTIGLLKLSKPLANLTAIPVPAFTFIFLYSMHFNTYCVVFLCFLHILIITFFNYLVKTVFYILYILKVTV